ncbi:MAG TPA: CDP-archaeol synthase [Candidatus Saccharimonadales bacterium]|nr:CDP-archaeol synthase [Candidatus Saccharimonadales bacterium]
MLQDIFFALWFFAPAAVANVVPIFAAALPPLKRYDAPMDFGKTYHGKRILGDHKTWRGLIAGVIFATLTLVVQQFLFDNVTWVRTLTDQVDYAHLPTLVLGPLFAIGALGGDALESFFKRQRNVAPGHGWFPFDQIDYIIGGAVVTMPFVSLTIVQYLWLILLWLIIHVISTYLGWLMGLKERPL